MLVDLFSWALRDALTSPASSAFVEPLFFFFILLHHYIPFSEDFSCDAVKK